MKLMELVVGKLLKNCHFSEFLADASKHYCEFLTNGNVTVKSII